MKQLITVFVKGGVLIILTGLALSACADYAEHRDLPANTPTTVFSNPTATSGVDANEGRRQEPSTTPSVGQTAEVTAANNSPITKQEVIEMWDSVENFASVIDRLEGLTVEEKQTLIVYITQELELNDEIHKYCSASLTTEESAALEEMNMGSPLYQQANSKFSDAMVNDPDCSKSSQELQNLMSQNGDLLKKVKSLISPYMAP